MELAKEMYQAARRADMTLTEFLEKERPSQKKGLDAFEYALFERGINLKQGTVEQFYRTHEDRVLFPEFINRNVRSGIVGLSRRDVTLDDIVATETVIDAAVYDSVKAKFDGQQDLDLKRVAEGAPFPTVTITTAKNTMKLAKIGIALEATYEALRRMRVTLLSAHMQLIGKRLAKKMVAYAVHVLVNGDGNSNGLAPTQEQLVYDNLLSWFLDMDDWSSTVWFAKKELLQEIMLLDEFKDSRLFETASKGAFATPFGNPLKKFNWKETALGDGQLFQLDKSGALEIVKEIGAELIETDKVIDQQFEKTSISMVAGFARIFDEAAMLFEKSGG